MNPTTPAPPPVWPGYAVPAGSYATPAVRHTSHIRLFVILIIALALIVAAVVTVSALITPSTAAHNCPPQCGRPPTGPRLGQPGAVPPGLGQPGTVPPPGAPVSSFPRFTADTGQFSVAYDPRATATLGSNGVKLAYDGINSYATFFGRPAGNQTPRDIAETLIQSAYPGAKTAYQIPNAMIGYQRGYGEIDDFYPQGGASSAEDIRVLVMVAVKNGYALIATATGPYEQWGKHVDDGHPSGANLRLAMIISDDVNRFMWRGDPPR
jgi:hypothetical protein